MALCENDCIKIAEAVKNNNVKYTVGYNRGMAQLIAKAADLLAGSRKLLLSRKI